MLTSTGQSHATALLCRCSCGLAPSQTLTSSCYIADDSVPTCFDREKLPPMHEDGIASWEKVHWFLFWKFLRKTLTVQWFGGVSTFALSSGRNIVPANSIPQYDKNVK